MHYPNFRLLALCAVLGFQMAVPAQERVDSEALFKIKDEGFQRSQVMEIMSYLTDVHGPRLTNSPQIRDASEWARKKLLEWGLTNVQLEPWGTFGRGWTNDHFSVHMVVNGHRYSLIGYPKAWTPGTPGAVTGEVVMAVIESDKDFEKHKGKLKGKFVLAAPMRDVEPLFDPLARRLTDEDLQNRARLNVGGPGRRGGPPADREFNRRRMKFFLDEGVASVLEPGRGDGGTVFVTGGGSPKPEEPPAPAQVVLAVEHYGRIVRILEKKIPVTLEMDIRNRFYDQDLNAYNLLAEFRGSDKPDEVVMLGAHFDSWHTGTGATDNAAGSAVMMEAVRILKTAGLRMRRTVRLGLWTGEEQGVLGSDGYVKKYFGDRHTMTLKPDHAKVSAYYNVDNGTGAIRGISLNGNEAVAPIFDAWVRPLRSIGMTTVAVGAPRQPPTSIGGTDHTPFDAVGLPGFSFIQDPMEYSTRTHHSNMDVYERIQPADMMKNAVIVATFVYHTANRESLLPRKPLHPPEKAP